MATGRDTLGPATHIRRNGERTNRIEGLQDRRDPVQGYAVSPRYRTTKTKLIKASKKTMPEELILCIKDYPSPRKERTQKS